MAPKQLWKTLDEFYGSPSVDQARRDEFAPDVSAAITAIRSGGETSGSANGLHRFMPNLSRRGFLQISGAATVFGMTGCWHNPPQTLVPEVKRPEGHVLGKADYYSTVVRDGVRAKSVVAKCYDYRPIKLEGNPDQPQSQGRLDLAGQAALLDLYDPDRQQKGPMRRDAATGRWVPCAWSELDDAAGKALSEAKRIVVLMPPIDGPAHAKLLSDLSKAFGERLEIVHFDPLANDRLREARAMVFGNAAAQDPVYHLGKAEVLVSLGSDILGGGETGLTEAMGFAEQRRLKGIGAAAQMGSFIAFEPFLSQGGSCADLRVRADLESMDAIAWAIAIAVAEGLGRSAEVPAWAKDRAAQVPAAVRSHPLLAAHDLKDPIAFTASQLVTAHQAGKASLIYAGGGIHSGRNSLPLLVAAQWLNGLLGNEGVTVSVTDRAETRRDGSLDATQQLLARCAKGEVDALILVDSNPLHLWPALRADPVRDADRGRIAPLGAVKTVIALNDRLDETAVEAHWFAPICHDLESWGDAEPGRGAYALQQPAIAPLWDSRMWQESLMALTTVALGKASPFRQLAAGRPAVLRSAASRMPLWQPEDSGVQPWRDFVRQVWTSSVMNAVGPAVDADAFWRGALARGAITTTPSAATASVRFAGPALAAPTAVSAASAAGYRLVLSPSRSLRDGRHANNAWLQEIPDPITKVTWDTCITLSIHDATQLLVANHSVVKVTLPDGRSHRLPVFIVPGQAAGTVEIFLGFGRDLAGAVANNGGVDDVQVNGFALSSELQRWGIPVQIEATGEEYRLATTQHHHFMDGRNIALDDTLKGHRGDPSVQREAPHVTWHGTVNPTDPSGSGHNLSMWGSSHVYPGRRWGMTIDLSTCTGCNACIVACSAENNVPVVGRDQVRRGREMHWIRIDRYFSVVGRTRKDSLKTGELDSWKIEKDRPEAPVDVEVIHQPMMCQQCGHAPCEEVCPAMATMHNDEGINVQVYNRCIGTRYCANNCPYKVRRFNFYEYSKYRFGPQGSESPFSRVMRNLVTEGRTTGQAELSVAPLEMALNPLISVRSKGVMEKCNFCIGRQRDVREEEKRSNRRYVDGSVTTACAQTCPSQAIVFGDINDPDSEVSRVAKAALHGYRVLDVELNTRPSVEYLRKVRNRPMQEHEVALLESNKNGGHGAHGSHDEKPASAGHGGAH